MSNYVTMDSFGSNLPKNWKEIAEKLNYYIDELGIKNDHDACNEVWEKFFNGEIIWYTALFDREDNDWSIGSYILDKAKKIVRSLRNDQGMTDAYLLAIREGENPVAIEEVEVD